jgi:hypothetical protein
VATSLTFETTVCSILSVNPAFALLVLICAPDDAALEPARAAPVVDGCSKIFSVLPAFFAELLTVPDFAAGVTFFADSVFGTVLEAAVATDFAAVFGAGFAVDFTTDLTVDLAGFATDLPVGRAVFVLVGMTAVLAVALLAFLAVALFAADLETVAFMIPSFPMNCPASRDSA